MSRLPPSSKRSDTLCPDTTLFRSNREASGKGMNSIAPKIPWLLGVAADLGPSTKTRLQFDGAGDFEADSYGGRNLHFGIRGHAMGAICNGLALSKLRQIGRASCRERVCQYV